MKKNRVFMFAAAVAALLLAGCNKEQQGYDSFILDIAGFSGADGSKAQWNDSGFWWENNTDPEGGDVVRINGDVHNIYRDGNQWKTHASAATNPIDGNYYIAYAGNGTNTTGMGWDSGSKLYGPVTFDGSIVPLARSGSGNRMTLDPCCAVIKVKSNSNVKINLTYEASATHRAAKTAYIDPSTASLTNSTGAAVKTYSGLVPQDGYAYCVIPIVGSELTCSRIRFNNSTVTNKDTQHEVVLKKGYLYTVILDE